MYDQHGLYLFEDGVRLDLTYKPRTAILLDTSTGVQILHDPQQVLVREIGANYRPLVRAHPRYFRQGDPEYTTWFLWMFRQIYAWTKRGAQGGERSFDKLAAAADSLHQVRASLVEMRLWTLDSGDGAGRADPDLALHLVASYPRLVPVELLRATRTNFAPRLGGAANRSVADHRRPTRRNPSTPASSVRRCRRQLPAGPLSRSTTGSEVARSCR